MRPTRIRRSPGRPEHPLTPSDIAALALPVFARRGPDGVGMTELAATANIRKGSLYHHYESKEALYAAVMQLALEGLLELITQARLDEGSFVERLDRLGSLIIDSLAARPLTARLLVRELIGAGPWLAAGGAARVQETLSLTAAFLEAGMQENAFRKSDPRHLALSIASLHLLPFAADAATGELLGGTLHHGEVLEGRRREVLAQVRALCGA